MKDAQRARRKIKAIIREAERERDTKGYRENLGYDQWSKLQDYFSTLGLTYSERTMLLQEFYRACDAI